MRLFLLGLFLSMPIALFCTWAGQLAQNPKAQPLLYPQLVNELPING